MAKKLIFWGEKRSETNYKANMWSMHQMVDKSMHWNWFWRLMANLTGRKLKKRQKSKINRNSKIQKIRPIDNVIRKQYTKFHESRTFGCWDVMYLSFLRVLGKYPKKWKIQNFKRYVPYRPPQRTYTQIFIGIGPMVTEIWRTELS